MLAVVPIARLQKPDISESCKYRHPIVNFMSSFATLRLVPFAKVSEQCGIKTHTFHCTAINPVNVQFTHFSCTKNAFSFAIRLTSDLCASKIPSYIISK